MEEKREYRNPVTDICEEEGKVMLRVEMAGVEKSNLDIQIDNDQLIIEGKRGDILAEGDFLVRERSMADYRKVFTLDETIDREKISATMENGILFLDLQLKEAVKPRKISIT
jgi:HSP20 family protein